MLVASATASAAGLLRRELAPGTASPMIDLALMRIRSLAAANAITLVAAAGFYAYVLVQRPLPDDGVGLQRARGRPRDHARAVHRRGGRAAVASKLADARRALRS